MHKISVLLILQLVIAIPVPVLSSLYSVYSMYTKICLDLCDSNKFIRSLPYMY